MRQAISSVKFELINIDGSVMGFARTRLTERILREAVFATLGEPGYETEVVLPVGPKGDARCPYRVRLTVE